MNLRKDHYWNWQNAAKNRTRTHTHTLRLSLSCANTREWWVVGGGGVVVAVFTCCGNESNRGHTCVCACTHTCVDDVK